MKPKLRNTDSWSECGVTRTGDVKVNGCLYTRDRLLTMNPWELFTQFQIHRGAICKENGLRFYCIGDSKTVGVKGEGQKTSVRQVWSYALLRKQYPFLSPEVEATNDQNQRAPLQGAPEWLLDIINSKPKEQRFKIRGRTRPHLRRRITA